MALPSNLIGAVDRFSVLFSGWVLLVFWHSKKHSFLGSEGRLAPTRFMVRGDWGPVFHTHWSGEQRSVKHKSLDYNDVHSIFIFYV